MTKPVETVSTVKPVDGVDHINIWVYAETELGRGLAQFAYSPFVHPHYGPFNSMEGFYHYVGTTDERPVRDKLRSLSGMKAKEYAKKLTRGNYKEFLQVVFNANFYKIEQNETLKKLIIESTLPFEQYYLFGPGTQIFPKQHERVAKDFEKIRQLFKDGERPPEIDYSLIAV